MGLDMFVYRVRPDAIVPSDADVDFETTGTLMEIGYWRKFGELHEWFASLYRVKGGKTADFNCVPVRINAVDLKLLRKDFRKMWKHSVAETRRIFNAMDDAINEGDAVFYEAWF